MNKFFCLFLFTSSVVFAHNYKVDETTKKELLASIGEYEKLPSEIAPHDILDRLMSEKVKPSIFCRIMKSLDSKKLSLFENTLNEERYNSLYNSCKTYLIKRLDSYWKKEIEKSSYLKLKRDKILKFNDSRRVVIDTSVNDYFGYNSFPFRDKEFLLTFDDGPFSHTSKILDILDDYNVKALFFHTGNQVKVKPEITRSVSREDHVLGSHSFNHPTSLPRLGTRNALEDIGRGHQVIFDHVGHVDPFFRFPGGNKSDALISELNKRNISSFHWDIDPKDWSARTSVDQIVDRVMKEIRKKRKGVILFHELRRSTWLALPTVLRKLKKEGYTPVIPVPRNSILRYTDPF